MSTNIENDDFTWWCGWEVPHGIPSEDLPASWPQGVTAWRSGGSSRYSTYVGAVRAPSAGAAWDLVRSSYGKHGITLRPRWEPHLRAAVKSDRFPGL